MLPPSGFASQACELVLACCWKWQVNHQNRRGSSVTTFSWALLCKYPKKWQGRAVWLVFRGEHPTHPLHEPGVQRRRIRPRHATSRMKVGVGPVAAYHSFHVLIRRQFPPLGFERTGFRSNAICSKKNPGRTSELGTGASFGDAFVRDPFRPGSAAGHHPGSLRAAQPPLIFCVFFSPRGKHFHKEILEQCQLRLSCVKQSIVYLVGTP